MDPDAIGEPIPPRHPRTVEQPDQTNHLTTLPPHILSQIALQLLDEPSFDRLDPTAITIRIHNLIPDDSICDFHNLLRTCTTLKYLDLPSSVWKLLTLDSVARFTSSLLTRWRANPVGVGTASNLWIALDEAFFEPIKIEFVNPDGVSMRDVWEWWSYSDGWRSRRRKWYCMIHACSTARDADWW